MLPAGMQKYNQGATLIETAPRWRMIKKKKIKWTAIKRLNGQLSVRQKFELTPKQVNGVRDGDGEKIQSANTKEHWGC